ncbi:NlpC/P60 family protein [Sphingobacterium sp. lm-10]|uniref:C40 family peptidase n=1 Tax=Sphingobacterium sp. lm-10 TaxID=2944904 RepID=UPI002020CBCB|nr:NlpC/P60 family protein [Sphingobacterium sp. lm-10]MCL7986356.1 NlpC/P60 family protein [Sphingobacterium sp. lm-10]
MANSTMKMMRYKGYHLFIILCGALLISSCGARKKGSGNSRYAVLESGKRSTSRNAPVSDASKARSMNYSGNKLDNYAQLLGVNSRDISKSSDLYLFIDDWMGTPHRNGGLDRNGMDCSAFVGLLYREVFSQNLPRTSRDMADNVKRKYENQLREGDLVFFSFGGRNIDHVGIYLHNGKFVHVSTKKGVIISDLKDTWYYRYFKRAGSPKT